MGQDNRVTMRQIYDTVVEIKTDLKALNGTVKTNCTDIAVLKEKVGAQETALGAQKAEQKSNWDRVFDSVLKPLIQMAVGGVITYFGLKGAP